MHISDGIITIEARATHTRYAEAIDTLRVAEAAWAKVGYDRKAPEFDTYVAAKNAMRSAKKAWQQA